MALQGTASLGADQEGLRDSYYYLHVNYILWKYIIISICSSTGFPSSSAVKNPTAMQDTQETWAQSLGREDPLEEGTATHSSMLVRKIPRTEESGGLQSIGSQRVRHD